MTTGLRHLLESQRTAASEIERRDGRIVPLVFFYKDGRQVKKRSPLVAVRLSEAGYPGRLFHDLRRTAVREPYMPACRSGW